MGRKRVYFCLGLWVLVVLSVACQPSVAYIEVTRVVEVLVEVTPNETTTPMIVTRVISEEVTRTVVEENIIEVTKPAVGSVGRPIQLLFPPVVNTTIIATRGQVLLDALEEATGYRYEIGVLDNESQIINLMCAAPSDTIGFLSAPGYMWANEQCGVQTGSVALRSDSLDWQMGMIVTRQDSSLTTLEELADKRWGIPDDMSLPNYLYFKAQFVAADIEVEELFLPGDSSAMLAVFNGEVDFATGTYIPPIMPYEERLWQYGEDRPEVWRLLGIPPSRSPIGYVLVLAEPEFGGYRVRDARAGIFDAEPEIFNETRILGVSEPIPNDTIAFGAAFPLELSRQVMRTLTDFTADADVCSLSLCSNDFYGWTGLTVASDEQYESLRFVVDTLDLTDTEMLGR